MNMSDSNARYHIVPRASEESDHEESSPNEQLLPSRPSPVVTSRFRDSETWTVDIQPVVWLRIFSTTWALTSFIILVLSGGKPMIAADVFLMMIIVLNVLQVINHCITHILKVTVELRRQSRSMSLGSDAKPRISMYFDVSLSLALMIALAVGGSILGQSWNRGGEARMVGQAFGWMSFGFQILLALPQLANKRLLLTAKLSDLKESTYTPDIKILTPPMRSTSGTNKASSRAPEEPVQSADDLV